MYDATKDDPKTEYLFGTTVRKVISNDEKSVKVELSNGNVETFDLVVAADGQWSKLRKQVFPDEEIRVVDKGMYAIYYTIPRIPDDNNWWNIYLALGSRTITLRPDPHGTTRAMFTHMPRTAAQKKMWQEASRADRQTQQDLLRRVFGDAGWQAPRLLNDMDAAPDWYFQAMQQIKMDSWSKNRVICLGDTAFAPTPLTGMGTSLAILSAYVLGGELSKLQDGEHPARALDAYEQELRPFVEKVTDIPFFVPGIGHTETALGRFIWRCCMRAIAATFRMPWIANRQSGTSDDDEDFPLSTYPAFEEETIKHD